MSNQFRYMKGDTKSEIFRCPPKSVMQGTQAVPFLGSTTVVFCIRRGELLFLDLISGCVYPAWLLSYTGNSVGATTAAGWQSAFAAVFVGVAEEKVGLAPGEFSPNPSLMYQDAIKVATAGVWEYDCPNQIFPSFVTPLGIAANANGICNSQYVNATSTVNDAQTVDALYGANTTTTNTVAATVTTIPVASGAGIANGSVIEVSTTGSAATAVTANVNTVIPASGTGVAGTSIGSAFIPILTGTGIGPGTTLTVATTTPAGVEEVYVTAVSGVLASTTLEYAISASQTTLSVTSIPSGLAIGCALLIGTELMVVTGFNPAAQPYPTITVGTRGSAGTAQGFGSTAATAAAAAAVTVYPVLTVIRGYNQTTAGTIAASAPVTPVSTPPEQMLVTAGGGTTSLTVTRGWNNTGTYGGGSGIVGTGYAIANGAIVTAMSTNLLQRIGVVNPSWGMNRQVENGQQQNRVCITIKPTIIEGGIPVSA